MKRIIFITGILLLMAGMIACGGKKQSEATEGNEWLDTDAEQNLYEAMEYAIIPDAQFGDVTAWDGTIAETVIPGINATQAVNVPMAPADEHFFALAIHMKEEAGNQYQAGSVTFDIRVDAAQQTAEEDSFGMNYDASATYALLAGGEATVTSATEYEIALMNTNGGKSGSMIVPAAAVATDASKIVVDVEECAKPDASVVLESDEAAKTYDITVTGLKEGNTEMIKVELNVGPGMTGVKLYHKNVEIPASSYSYNSVTGVITFQATSFSPYTVVFDRVAVAPEVEMPNTDLPKAIVENADEFENVAIEWVGYGGFYPGTLTQQLESAYIFTAPHDATTVQENAYKNWYCDYYVKLVSDKMTVLPEGSITLGGNYGNYGWVGFDNPEVNTNEWSPLLGSVFSNGNDEGQGNSGWTYADIASFVQTFKCGVGRTAAGVANTNMNGAQFVVALRLTNPENANEYFDVNTVTYTFGTGASVIK